jgi:hypothetical protein
MLGCKTLNNGLGVNVESTGGAYRYDRQTGPSEPTLAYGWRWSSTFFLCWSRMTGVTCRSKYSREGFSINRDGIDYLGWPSVLEQFADGGTHTDDSRSGSGSTSGPDDSGTASGLVDCTPGYTPCLPYNAGADYDCSGGSGNGPYYTVPGAVYTVSGSDPYGLDANGNGLGCE